MWAQQNGIDPEFHLTVDGGPGLHRIGQMPAELVGRADQSSGRQLKTSEVFRNEIRLPGGIVVGSGDHRPPQPAASAEPAGRLTNRIDPRRGQDKPALPPLYGPLKPKQD